MTALVSQIREAKNCINGRTEELAIGILNIDSISKVTVDYSYETMLELIRQIYQLLLRMTRSHADHNAHAFYLQGDEFLIAVNDSSGEGFFILEEIRNEIYRTYFTCNDHEVHVSVSIGAIRTSQYPEASDLIRNACQALAKAKTEKNTTTLYTQNNTPAPKSFSSAELQRVINADEPWEDLENTIVPYFQPIYLWRNNQWILAGFEVLLRGKKEGKIIPPHTILKKAELSGSMFELELLVITKGLFYFSQLQQTDLFLSINLTPIHLARNQRILDIISTASQYAVPLQKIHLEILEKKFLVNADVITNLLFLKSSGVKLYIDDVGAEASIRNVMALIGSKISIDGLKIDRKFIEEATKTKLGEDLIRTLIMMGYDMNVALVVEGLESEDHREFIENIGEELAAKSFFKLNAQGFFFSKPMPPHELPAFTQTNAS